jgi:hypothetical protein
MDRPESDVKAILELLAAAQLSVSSHGDTFCAGLLDRCAAHLRERYGLAAVARCGDPAWADSGVPAVVHLLIYVKAEVDERLYDPACVEVLDQCIGRLLHSHWPRTVTAH